MLELEDVCKRRDNLLVKLDIAIKELSKKAYRDDASVTLVKRYNKYLQNRTNLKNMDINETNYKYLVKDIKLTEADVNRYFRDHPEALKTK